MNETADATCERYPLYIDSMFDSPSGPLQTNEVVFDMWGLNANLLLYLISPRLSVAMLFEKLPGPLIAAMQHKLELILRPCIQRRRPAYSCITQNNVLGMCAWSQLYLQMFE